MEAGERFPDFTAQTQDDEEINLAKYQAGQNLVLFVPTMSPSSGCGSVISRSPRRTVITQREVWCLERPAHQHRVPPMQCGAGHS